MGDLQPWHIAIILLVFVVFFGYKKLPDASRSIGRSLRIFKAETKGLVHDHEGPEETATAAAATPIAIPAPVVAPAPVAAVPVATVPVAAVPVATAPVAPAPVAAAAPVAAPAPVSPAPAAVPAPSGFPSQAANFSSGSQA